ncbi:outer membrane lipoprotein-sorting protein [Marinirhabdus gelatinilytica]|uniref:Outer membrane lipoprotein-sorting protein n=1 Tax=Marinirhabdus gelatinilytica TaxID=1703343 RepID=A0A370QA49_9FLAO|nr:outer membrane lipoprotein-sorting protein [Marinirhabdus gelatinilytica]RDK85261.1 hypothetical protein C8D94_10379 [Marinirhabdus gelatinilytica]
MKTVKTLFFAIVFAAISPLAQAQDMTADEIIDAYFENTGGQDNWEDIESLRYTGTANVQGMEFPWIMTMTEDGKQALVIDFQGQKITQYAYDGETMWTTNFMTQEAEKADAETSDNMKKASKKNFISPLLNYKDKGYEVELIGNETIEGTDTYKIKLTEDPIMVDGVETPKISYYFFEKENMVPIAIETEVKQGPMAGQKIQDSMSDYQEVDGLYFPFSMTQGGQAMQVTKIEVNPEIDDAVFAFPEKK